VAPAPVASLSRGDVSPRAAALLFSTDSAEAGGELEIEINDVTRENLKRQMLYRSQQRGWLELDLVMVSFIHSLRIHSLTHSARL